MADKVFTMRIDENLLEQIRVKAEKHKRSLAKEIEFALDMYYNGEVYNIDISKEIWEKFLKNSDKIID